MTSGYRSLARFRGSEVDLGFELTLDSDRLEPGASGEGELSFWATDHVPAFEPGDPFEMREGERVVGRGVVLADSTKG